MKKEDVLKVCEKVCAELEEDLTRKNEEVKKGGGNVKSLKSIISGIRKNYALCNLFKKLIRGEDITDDDVKLIERLGYNKKADLKEVSKEEVIKGDLIDKVIIKRINGINKYYIEV